MDPLSAISAMAGAVIATVVGFFGGRAAGKGEGLAQGRFEALRVAMHESLEDPPKPPKPPGRVLPLEPNWPPRVRGASRDGEGE